MPLFRLLPSHKRGAGRRKFVATLVFAGFFAAMLATDPVAAPLVRALTGARDQAQALLGSLSGGKARATGSANRKVGRGDLNLPPAVSGLQSVPAQAQPGAASAALAGSADAGGGSDSRSGAATVVTLPHAVGSVPLPPNALSHRSPRSAVLEIAPFNSAAAPDPGAVVRTVDRASAAGGRDQAEALGGSWRGEGTAGATAGAASRNDGSGDIALEPAAASGRPARTDAGVGSNARSGEAAILETSDGASALTPAHPSLGGGTTPLALEPGWPGGGPGTPDLLGAGDGLLLRGSLPSAPAPGGQGGGEGNIVRGANAEARVTATVPEPGALVLLGIGVAGLMRRRMASVVSRR